MSETTLLAIIAIGCLTLVCVVLAVQDIITALLEAAEEAPAEPAAPQGPPLQDLVAPIDVGGPRRPPGSLAAMVRTEEARERVALGDGSNPNYWRGVVGP
jgi:hypothetical protein